MVDKKKEIDEQKSTATSYIITFYQNIQLLNHWTAIYNNIILEASEYEDNKIPQQLIEKIGETSQNLRYYINITRTQYLAINDSLNNKETKKQEINTIVEELKQSFINIEKTYIINTKEANNYTLTLNQYLLKSIIKTILETQEDIINQVF